MVIDLFHDSSETISQISAVAPAVYCSNTVWFWKHFPYCKKTKQEKKFSGLVTCTYKQPTIWYTFIWILRNLRVLEFLPVIWPSQIKEIVNTQQWETRRGYTKGEVFNFNNRLATLLHILKFQVRPAAIPYHKTITRLHADTRVGQHLRLEKC